MAYRRQQDESYVIWIILGILLLILIAILIAFVASSPSNSYPYYRDASPNGKYESSGRVNCTVGEYFDKQLEMCAPLINTPIPISHELMDETAKPCDSFYRYMSGNWIKTHQNENRGFTFVHRRNQKLVHDIIRDPRSGGVYTFFRSCMDTLVYRQHKMLDSQQISHVTEHILGALRNHGDLPVAFARLASYGFTSPFFLAIEPHPTELKMIPMIRYDNFEDFDPALTENALKVAMKLKMWRTDVEYQGSYVHYVQSGRFHKDLVPMKFLLDAGPPNFWKLYLRELNGYSMEEDIDRNDRMIWVIDKEYIRNFLNGIPSITVQEWRDYVKFLIDHNTRDYLPEFPSDSYFRIHSPLKRRGEHRHRMKRNKLPEYTELSCLKLTHKLMPGIIGNIYLAKNVKEYDQLRKNVTKIVENVRDSFASLLQNTSWLSDASKAKAVEKIQSIIVRSVVPTYYEAEPFTERLTLDHYLRNLLIIRQYFAKRNLQLWTAGEPDRDEIQRFGAPLTEVNAFYSPVTNTITIFAGILNMPFYSSRYDLVGQYATLGMIASHELGHAMDVNGRLFDKDGSIYMHEPWNATELQEFHKRLECLQNEYVAPFGCDNAQYGHQTLGEDMADLSGVKSAYHAFLKADPNATDVDRQYFFQIFAQMWAETYGKEEYCDRVQNDVHAVAEYRVDKTLRQMEEFRRIFGCKHHDNMVNEESCLVYG
jgi:predicted metalloendopeptidase